MNKVLICLAGCFLLIMLTLHAQVFVKQSPDPTRQIQDTARQVEDLPKSVQDTVRQIQDSTAQPSVQVPVDSTKQVQDSTMRVKDSVSPAQTDPKPAQADPSAVPPYTRSSPDSVKPSQDNGKDTVNNTITPDNTSQPMADSAKKTQDTTTPAEPTKRELDTRWFISPLLKGGFQDFGLLEKNRKGYLSDANTLPFADRGNWSFAASAYKNLTGRLSASADIGFAFGHVTSDKVLISQTKKKTYNLLNATVYYHLLNASYRLQPYLTVGINDLINDASYASVPMGLGAKFNAKKIMVLGQITYGYGLSKNMSSTTMYSMGIYLPIRNKKQKLAEAEDKSPYNRKGKDDDKKKDTTAKNGGIVNNIYITINMDSVLKSKGIGNDDDNGNSSGGRRRKKGGGNGGNDDPADDLDNLKSLNLEDFSSNDVKVDTVDGRPVIRFRVYFEFNEYSLNTKAFTSIDKVISHLKSKSNIASVEIKGYTDDVGTDQYNNFLSRRRAKMVLDYMNSRGMPSELMQAKAYGSDDPVADNKDPNTAWLNRRAEIIVRLKRE
ncbi:OmpA family protein [Flavitalea flava]